MDTYFINGIKLDDAGEHIEWVRVRKSTDKKQFVVRREFIAQLIGSGVTFKSRYLNGDEWTTGADVEVYDVTFLRANPNSTGKDNLRNLQRFTKVIV